MKPVSILTTIAALAFGAALQADSLLPYDFNTGSWDPIIPGNMVSQVNVGSFRHLGLTMEHNVSGARDGSAYNTLTSLDYEKDFSFDRVDLTRSMDAISFDFSINDGTHGSLAGVSFDLMRPFNDSDNVSASSFQAAIFWADANGAIQYGKSATINVSGSTWSTVNLNFISWSAALPADLGDTSRYLVEIYGYGGSGNNGIYVDNIALNGNLNVQAVPEPGSAVLMLASGMVCLVFRRRRSA